MVAQMVKDFWGVGIEHTGGHNKRLSMDNLQVRGLPVSSASALLTSFEQCVFLV